MLGFWIKCLKLLENAVALVSSFAAKVNSTARHPTEERNGASRDMSI